MSIEEIKAHEEKENALVIKNANELVVDGPHSLELASEYLKEFNRRIKVIKDKLKEPVEKAHAAHKALTSLRSELLSPNEQAKNIVNGKVSTYQMEQDRIRRRQEEEERRAAEEKARKEAEDRRLEQAEQAQAAGMDDMAEDLLEAPIDPGPIEVPQVKQEPKPEGMSFRKEYYFEIQDEEQIPRAYMVPNEQAIRAVVKSLKEKCRIPGVKVMHKLIPIQK